MNKNIDGKFFSTVIKDELKEYVEKLDIKPGMAVIQIGDDLASNVYIKNKEKAANYIGINYSHFKFNATVLEEEVINKINELNEDKGIDGIIVQLPIPKHLNEKKIINMINPDKDIDGLTIMNSGKLINNEDCLVSCTPQGIIELLNRSNIDIDGKNVVIVGRSILVGKPLFNLFLNNNATVTICHSHTKNLASITKNADILVVAIGKAKFITKDMVKDGSIVIDVGINRIDNKLYGDVDYDNVVDKVSLITPVPGGVGPMTVAMLMYNVVKSYKKSH